jgi:hypothetical protein
MMDTTDAQYWTVPAASTVVAVTEHFASIENPTSDPDKAKHYIGFSTQKDQVARLVSTNLYLDGNPANNAESNFRLDGTIELTFADIPAGTRISKVQLATSANASTGLSVYARFDPLNANKVLITPNAPLKASGIVTYYFLQLELSKTIGADPVWSVEAKDGASGIHESAYVFVTPGAMPDDPPDAQEIRFKTVSAFSVVPFDGLSLSLTNLEHLDGTNNGQFDATGDIVIEFDRPVAKVDRAQLRYNDGGVYFGITASADETNLSPDKKVLTIAPTNLLAPGANFKVRLDVTSEDGQQIVYDTTSTGDPSAWANQTYNRDLDITTDTVVRLTGISKQAASAGTLTLVSGTNVVKTASDITLHFVPTRYDFANTFRIYARRVDIWGIDSDGILQSTPTSLGTIVVPQGSTAAIDQASIPIPGAALFEHFTNEGIVYKVRGISNTGFAAEATSPQITFAN